MSDLLNQASLVMIPSGYKEDTVFSQLPQDGSGDLSFTRASNGTRVNSAGLVEVTPWNLVQQSEQIDNAAWIKFNCSITPNDAIAPNGTQTADKVVFSGSGHYFYQQTSFIGQATASIYVKGTAGETISIDNTQAITEPLITLTGEWQRITTTTTTSGSSVQGIALSTFQSATARTIYVWGGQVNAGTLKPYFPTTDRLNVPRLTYQNGGGGCPSLLLEKQSTNVVKYSEDFTQSDWLKQSGATITANSIISPDGTQNATRVQFSAGSRYVYQSISGVPAGSVTISCYIKGASVQKIGFSDGNNNPNEITLTTDWQRYTFTFTYSGGGIGFQFDNYFGVTPNQEPKDFYIWGAQLEASSYATSYIPTTSSSATRVADECFKTGISSLIGQTEGTLFVEIERKQYDAQAFWVNISDNSYNNWIFVGWDGFNSRNYIRVGNTVYADGGIGNMPVGTYKIAISYKSGDSAAYVNGVQAWTDSDTWTLSGLNTLNIGGAQPVAGGMLSSGSLNQAVLFKTRLPNSKLASLTTI